VIYQNQNNVWKYLAGTMWGTLSPDQRPTDLGVNDGGFDFRGTDQQREFIWSQSAWIEVTPVTGALNLTHPNVVTKVSSTSGGIVEGGITDESAANSNRLHITAGGNIGIGTSAAAVALDINATGGSDDVLHLNCVPGSGPYMRFISNASTKWTIGHSLGQAAAGSFVFYSSIAALILTAAGGIALPGLPSTNPGGGTKQLWYDPADGNRVKFAP
jgi:hypothetical protein